MNQSTRLPKALLFSICLATVGMGGSFSSAQQKGDQPKAATPDPQGDWYYGPGAVKSEPRSIAQLKSAQRAQQRMARLEAMRWYGFSASRPTASGIPFTSMYSPAWTRPGGRPFAWYTGGGPGVVIHRPYRAYRY